MSDTPMTDEETGYYDGSGCWHYCADGETVRSEFVHQLERKYNIVVAELNNIINSRPYTWDYGSKLETLEEYEIWTKSRAQWALEQIGER